MQPRMLKRVVSGPVVHQFGPFRVRRKFAQYEDGGEVALGVFAICLVQKEPLPVEDEITLLHSQEVDLPSVVRRLHAWLDDFGRLVDEQERIYTEASTPEGLAALQAQLDAREPSPFEIERGARFTAAEWLEPMPEGIEQSRLRLARVKQALSVLAADQDISPS